MTDSSSVPYPAQDVDKTPDLDPYVSSEDPNALRSAKNAAIGAALIFGA